MHLNIFYKVLFTLFFSITIIPTSHAQILNIERARVDRDSVNYLTGKAGLSFSMFNQNAGRNNPNNFLQFTFNGDLAYISARHSYLLINYFNYLLVNYDTKELRNTVASNGYSHLRANFFRKRRLSYELFAQAQTDKARGLELRVLSGGGIRVAVLRTDAINLYTGTGLMLEHEEWENPELDDVLAVSNLLKSTNYFSVKARLNEHVSTDGIIYYQTGYDHKIDGFRNRVSGNMVLNVKLNRLISLRTNFSCTYEDEPIVPVTKFVYALSNGLQVNF